MSIRDQGPSESTDGVPAADGGASIRLRDVESSAALSRRGVLWKAGIATAGAVGALSLLDQRRAEAATGGNFVLGQANDANATTQLHPTSGTSPKPLMMIDGTLLAATSTSLVAKGPAGGVALTAQGFSTNSTQATIGLAINGAGDGQTNGIYGSSGSGYGVTGQSASGPGVQGLSSSGSGVFAQSATGNALTVNGKTSFSRSGVNNIPSGIKTKQINVTGMTASSGIIATLQTFAQAIHIEAVVPGSGHFTVHLKQNAPVQMKFAWFAVVG